MANIQDFIMKMGRMATDPFGSMHAPTAGMDSPNQYRLPAVRSQGTEVEAMQGTGEAMAPKSWYDMHAGAPPQAAPPPAAMPPNAGQAGMMNGPLMRKLLILAGLPAGAAALFGMDEGAPPQMPNRRMSEDASMAAYDKTGQATMNRVADVGRSSLQETLAMRKKPAAKKAAPKAAPSNPQKGSMPTVDPKMDDGLNRPEYRIGVH